ncbi:MAG: RNHCP domain-containing protein [bacterium]
MRKNFIPRNDAFVCERCGKKVVPASGTFRNHCPFCLTSKHVDKYLPGDRLSICGGLMPVIRYEGTDPDKLELIQQCKKCGRVRRNRTAPDDNKQLLF